jgi:hypothetical protein
MLQSVGQRRPVEVALRAVLIYSVRFVIFFVVLLVKLVMWDFPLFSF